MTIAARRIAGMLLTGLLLAAASCKTGVGGVSGNEGGSDPINDAEAQEYKKAVVRCYKTGGSRVVKIQGVLRCY